LADGPPTHDTYSDKKWSGGLARCQLILMQGKQREMDVETDRWPDGDVRNCAFK